MKVSYLKYGTDLYRSLRTAYCCTITFPVVVMVVVAEPPAPVAAVPLIELTVTATGALVNVTAVAEV